MKRCFLTITLMLGIAAAAFAQQSDPNRELINSLCADDYSKAAHIVLYDSTDVDVKESGLSYVHMHTLTLLNSDRSAESHRQVNFDYDPLSADITVKYAKIYRKDGTVETVDPSQVYDYPAPARAIYWGARKKTVNFGRLEKGDAIEIMLFRKGFTYALLFDDDDKFVPPMRGHFYDIVNFWTGVPILNKVYRIAMPKDKPLQYEVYNGELSSYIHFSPESDAKQTVAINPHKKEIAKATPQQEEFYTVPGKTVYCWYKQDMQPFKSEPNMLAGSDVAPKLLVSTSADWYQKAVWFHNVNEDFGSFDVTPEVQEMTDNLLKGVSDEMEKVKILTHWVAEEVRYSGISMGEGEGYTLHKGEMTFNDRCGVCKDKAGMLVTMLRAAGFESYPAMTMAGSRIDRIPADQFNHSVTVVKMSNGEWNLLDPTWVPGVRELWSSAEQQQEFLMGVPGGSDLMTTPISPAENHYFKLKGESELLKNGTLKGEFQITADGQSDAGLRRTFNRSYKSSREEFIYSILDDLSPNIKIKDFSFSDPDDLSEPMKITVEYEINNYAAFVGDKIIFTPLLARDPLTASHLHSELSMNTDSKEKNYGFRTRCSKLYEISETIELPSFSKALVLPEFENITGEHSAFEAKYELKKGTLTLTAKHLMGKRLYDACDWPDFRSSLLERKKLMESLIILEK